MTPVHARSPRDSAPLAALRPRLPGKPAPERSSNAATYTVHASGATPASGSVLLAVYLLD